MIITLSVHLNVDIDVPNELQGSKEGDGAQHQKKDVTGENCVTEEFNCL